MTTTEPDDPRARRTTERSPFDEEVRFVVRQEIVGQGVDIGAGGIGVVSPIDMPPGQSLEITILGGSATAFGTVRWSAPADGGYRLGIQFREEDWAIMQLVDTLRAQEG